MLLSNIKLIEASVNYNHVFTSYTQAELFALTTAELGETVYVTDIEPGVYTCTNATAGSITWSPVGTKYIVPVTEATKPVTGKAGLIYVTTDTLKSYYWNDTEYKDLAQSTVDSAISTLKGEVPTVHDTLKKLSDAVLANANEVIVADIAARDAYNVPAGVPFNIFVTDDGDGRWALYKSLTSGVGATFVKLSDPDLLNAAVGFTPEDSANKSTDGTLADNSDTKYPSQKAVKSYVDNKYADSAAITVFRRAAGTVSITLPGSNATAV